MAPATAFYSSKSSRRTYRPLQKAFRVAFALLFLSQTLTGCGQRGKSEDEVLMESLGRERARMESLFVVGKDKLLEAGLKSHLMTT